jgi:8-oxo-dGTP diphosphatase
VNHVKVAVGIITRHNQVLIAERPVSKPYNGYWEFPGGKLTQSETAEQALIRELQEELGITVLSCKHMFDHIHDYETCIVELSIWQVPLFSNEPHSEEQQKLAWVDFETIMDYPLLPGNWAILNQLKSIFDS